MCAGDQAPPPYPIVDVHVPISMVGAFEKKWEADDNQQRVQQLEAIEHRLAASDEMLWASVAPLVAKIEQVTAMAEAAVCSWLALFCLQLCMRIWLSDGCYFWQFCFEKRLVICNKL